MDVLTPEQQAQGYTLDTLGKTTPPSDVFSDTSTLTSSADSMSGSLDYSRPASLETSSNSSNSWDVMGLGDLTGMQKVQTGLGAISTAYSLYDNLFGNSAKTSELQRENLETQIDTNKYMLAKDKAHTANINKYFG